MSPLAYRLMLCVKLKLTRSVRFYAMCVIANGMCDSKAQMLEQHYAASRIFDRHVSL